MASCSVSPDPCPVGSQYSVSVSGATSGDFLQAWVQDSHGLQVLGCDPVAADGMTQGQSYASWPGDYAVTIYHVYFKGNKQHKDEVGSCIFTAA